MARDGLPAQMIRFIGNWLTNRKLSVRIGKTIGSSINLKSGVPQGSVLSPILWNYWLGDAPSTINPHAQLSLYADDIALWISHRQASRAIKILNEEIKNLINRCYS